MIFIINIITMSKPAVVKKKKQTIEQQTIEKLKKLTGHRSNRAFAEFLGVTKSTIYLAKSGTKTKLHSVLPMLLHLISTAHDAELKAFLGRFVKQKS